MSVELNSNLKYIPKRNTLTLAKCWKIKRQDGKQFAYTDHDISLSVDGILFEANNSIMASAAEQSIGLNGGNAELKGMVSSEAIGHGELLAGLFNNAVVTEYVVDWKYPFAGPIYKTEFVIVQLTYNNNYWRADIEGYSNILSNPVGKVCSRLCPYVFGSEDCGVNKELYSSGTATVADVSTDDYNTRQHIKLDKSFTTNQYNLGSLIFTTGENALYSYDIALNSDDEVTLFLQTGFDIQVGDTLYMLQGCDRNHTTCKVYNNITRFGGFPFIIGRDKMITRPDQKKA